MIEIVCEGLTITPAQLRRELKEGGDLSDQVSGIYTQSVTAGSRDVIGIAVCESAKYAMRCRHRHQSRKRHKTVRSLTHANGASWYKLCLYIRY
jgi:hypothetical protein